MESKGTLMFSHFQNNHFFILTGAMGAGKSTILKKLSAQKFRYVEEPARLIIAEQRSIEGQGVYEKDSKLFIELILSRALFQFQQIHSYQGPVIFDRGIPDMIAYANLAGLNLAHIQKAAEKYRYNNLVFFAPAWEEIYTTDEERKMSFEAAKAFGEDLRNIYLNLGYKIIDLPLDAPEVRAQFIIKTISNNDLS